MHPYAQLIVDFYEAFKRRDHEAMVKSYHPDVHFSDPVFPELRGWKAAAMWQMLCEGGTDLTLSYTGCQADDATGHIVWEANYSFGPQKRKVNNIIHARFEYKDDLIVRHEDEFSLWRWSRQALGAPGLFMGWSPMVQNKVRAQAASSLEKFIAERGLGPKA